MFVCVSGCSLAEICTEQDSVCVCSGFMYKNT